MQLSLKAPFKAETRWE